MSSNRKFYKGLPHYSAAVVGKKTVNPNQLKYMLKSVGFTNLTTYPNHLAAVEAGATVPLTHILFEAKEGRTSVPAFVERMLEFHKNCIMIAVTDQPRIDNIFELVRRGARGFLATPLNLDMMEQVLLQATDGPPFSDLILAAENRNQAFAEVILNNLYRLTNAMRHSREHHFPVEALHKLNVILQESIEMATMFCEFSEENLRESIIKACIHRADDEKTKLSRLRKSLRQKRQSGPDGDTADAPG